MKYRLWVLIFVSSTVTAQNKVAKEKTIQHQIFALTEVMYHDAINPPAAARFYAYSVLAGYEMLSRLQNNLPRIQDMFVGFQKSDKSLNAEIVDIEFAVFYAILEAGKNLIPSGYLLEEKQQQLRELYIKSGSLPKKIDSSISLAMEVSAELVSYARSDGYFQLSTLSRYKPFTTKGTWKPTPPEYMAAIEPNWKTIRTFFLDSCDQFKPVLCESFDLSDGSVFMQMMKEVQSVSRSLTDEQKLVANFWDCNPFAVQFEGHMSIGLKKISPGGHWMGITGIACKNAGLEFGKTLFLHTLVALTLHDAFISCWDEKYRSNRIRPETAINKYLDPGWKPLLQTPPFPEYSSGHSVISTAAANVLTHFLGDRFEFIDTTQSYIGLPARTFSSFSEAAAEARISRLYGGIHFRDAIENGGEQGRRLGEFVVKKIGVMPLR